MGRTFYEGTMPSIARNLATISEGIGLARAVMDRLVAAVVQQNELKAKELELRAKELDLRAKELELRTGPKEFGGPR
jgi:hypothetical protein